MRTSRSIAGPIAIAVLAVLLIPAAASAATKKIVIKPNALHPEYSLQGGQSGFGVFDAQYWATLKLPVNATITGLSFRRFATSAVEETWVSLERVKVGVSPSRQQIYAASATDASPAGSTGHIVTGNSVPGAVRKVTTGWDYYIHAGSGAESAQIVDVTVKFVTP